MGGTSQHGRGRLHWQQRQKASTQPREKEKKMKERNKEKKPTQQINKSIPNKLEMSYYIRDHKIKPRKVQVARTCC